MAVQKILIKKEVTEEIEVDFPVFLRCQNRYFYAKDINDSISVNVDGNSITPIRTGFIFGDAYTTHPATEDEFLTALNHVIKNLGLKHLI